MSHYKYSNECSGVQQKMFRMGQLSIPSVTSGKESDGQCRRCKRHELDPWVSKIPQRGAWQPIPGFLPGLSHGQRSLARYSPWGCKKLGTTEATQHKYRGQIRKTVLQNLYIIFANSIKCTPDYFFSSKKLYANQICQLQLYYSTFTVQKQILNI